MSDDNLQPQPSTLTDAMPSLARYRDRIGLVVGLLAVLVFANLLLGVIDEFTLIRRYLLERGSFIRTQAFVIDLEETTGFNSGAFKPQRHTVTYQFRRSDGVVRVSRDIPDTTYDDLVIGQSLEVNFYKDNPSISYLRNEEPFIITIGLRFVGLLISAGLIYWGLIRGLNRFDSQMQSSNSDMEDKQHKE